MFCDYFVIYQIHDFCVNSFHYHNANFDDYYNRYQTLAVTACEAASVDHNSSEDCFQTDDDYNGEKVLSHLSYFDGDSADAIEDGADLMAMNNKSHSENAVTSVPAIN